MLLTLRAAESDDDFVPGQADNNGSDDEEDTSRRPGIASLSILLPSFVLFQVRIRCVPHRGCGVGGIPSPVSSIRLEHHGSWFRIGTLICMSNVPPVRVS